MHVAFFGSSLVSAYWNGAATYYRGLLRALHDRGFRTTFYEPDAYERQKHRDIPDPDWARVRVYAPTQGGVDRALTEASDADLIVKASGIGVFDEYLEECVAALQGPKTMVAFWDVDAPATLTRVAQNPGDAWAALVPRYDIVFTYGGGPPVVEGYKKLGARVCVPIYNAVDPATHHPVAAARTHEATLSFLGNRLPDREHRVGEFFLKPASLLPDKSFLLGGNGWQPGDVPSNVRCLGHVYTRDHNEFYASPLAVLNVSRQSMATFGYSPATRVFEAAGAGACLITDAWLGIDQFLEPGREILVADNGEEVAEHLKKLDERSARSIGQHALARVLAEHTYTKRAIEVEEALQSGRGNTSSAVPLNHPAATRHSPSAQTAVTRPARDAPMDIVFIGLSITSSWGNGHATTYRALIRELSRLGHRVLFLEQDAPWYAEERDLPHPPYCRTELYSNWGDLCQRFKAAVQDANLVVVGSFVPEGAKVGEWVTRTANGLTAFYDIDTPLTLSRLREGKCEYLSRSLIPRYGLYLSFAGGPVLESLEQKWGARMALPLYCSADSEVYYPETSELRWDLGYMGTYSDDRQPSLEQLLLAPARAWPEGRFAVAGTGYPDQIAWPKAVQRLGHLRPDQHRQFFNQQRFTLNVTRNDMTRLGFSPSVRLFEAAAAGTAIVTDRSKGLSHFFTPGREILVVENTQQVLTLLKHLPEEQRLALGQRARARVLREHTPAHRARTLVEYAKRGLKQLEPTMRIRSA